MTNTKLILYLILAAAAGAILALWLGCPYLCKQGVQGKLAGILQNFGLSSDTAATVAADLI